MQTLEQLRTEIEEASQYNTYAYYVKQVHAVPDVEVAHRERFILAKCIDKVVLDIGCNGPLHEQIKEVAKEAFGIDKIGEDREGFWRLDIEKDPNYPILIKEIPFKLKNGFPEVIVCGEILEHLSNPGLFLDSLRFFNCEIIVTVPNAFASGHEWFVRKGRENVNTDHVAWYSYYTLKTLVKRYGYIVKEFYWADQRDTLPGFAEGIIFVIQQGGKNG